MDIASSYPANGATVGDIFAVSIAFTEPVVAGADCVGGVSVVRVGASGVNMTACSDLTTYDNYVVLLFGSALPAGDYYITVDSGALTDLAGNMVTYITTTSSYTFTVASATATVPSLLYSAPLDGGAFDGNLIANVSTITLDYSVAVTAKDAFIELEDCGADFKCGTTDDALLYRFAATSLNITDSTVSIEAEILGTTYKRWKLTVPAGAFEGPVTPSLTAATTIEFLNDRTGFSYAMVIHPDAAASTAEGIVFSAKLASTTPTGLYSLCYCDDQADETLEDLGDAETTYKLEDNMRVPEVLTSALVAADVSGVTVAGMPLASHECISKCTTGCIGPSCFCDGFTGAGRTEAAYFCLSPSLCRDACDELGTSCAGISVHDTLPQCILASAGVTSADGVVAEEWQYFAKSSGTACSQVHDFSTPVGSIAVTSRVDVAVDFVVQPGEDVSIELTAPAGVSLTYEESNGLQSKDRIMVIDSLGTCGLSGPSTSVELNGEESPAIDVWSTLAPFSYFQEGAWADTGPGEGAGLGPNIPDPAKVVETPDVAPSKEYNDRPGFFCPDNMDIDGLSIPLSGVMVPVKDHQCYTKCALNAPCVGDQCYCGGYFSGYDDIDSNAICANENFCKYICDNTPGCKSIDMHTSLDRCFLNMEGCDLHSDHLLQVPDMSYTLMIQRTDPNDGARRQLDDERRTQANTVDMYSWSKMLRFKSMVFTTGGTFKVCFCDSALLPGKPDDFAPCAKAADFSVEVGTVHSSGVSCLLEKPALQRVACVEQMYGGLRCYEKYSAPEPMLEIAAVSFD
jgi:hypothetical protein